jgi:hypothetical protein
MATKKTTRKKTTGKKATPKAKAKTKRKATIKLSTLDAAKVRSKLKEIREIGKKYRTKYSQGNLF